MKFRHFFKKTSEGPSFAEYREGNVLMRLDFFKNMLRVALIKDGQPMLPTWSVCPDGNMPCEGRSRLSAEGFEKETPKLTEKDGKVFFELSGARFCALPSPDRKARTIRIPRCRSAVPFPPG